MTFGKRGRPAEDRIGRRNEIYEAVGPLIMSAGCRKLSMRDAAHAALEIGSGELQARLDAGLATNVAELVETLRQLAPDLDDAGLADLARAIRRLALGALIDANSNLAELERQMRALVRAHTAHQKSGVALGG